MIQALANPPKQWSAGLLNKLHIPNVMELGVPHTPQDFYTCPFKTSKLDRLVNE